MIYNKNPSIDTLYIILTVYTIGMYSILYKLLKFEKMNCSHSLNQLYSLEIFISIYGNNNQSYWIGFCLSYCNSFYVSLMSEDNHEEVFTLEISLSFSLSRNTLDRCSREGLEIIDISIQDNWGFVIENIFKRSFSIW